MVNRGKVKWNALRDLLIRNDQDHVVPFFENLGEDRHSELLAQLESIDFSQLRREVLRLRRPSCDGSRLRPATCIPLPGTTTEKARWKQAWVDGETVLRRGEVAVITVAGGQGTRLGFDRPKGFFPITPVKGKSLFQLFAEKIRAGECRYGCTVPWLILTGPDHLEETKAFFVEQKNFGLREVYIFAQGQLPTIDMDGKLILSAKDSVAMHPDGHGGLLCALEKIGLLQTLRLPRIRHFSYFQVDNPLASPLDPYFIGFHTGMEAQVSSRCVRKNFPGEKVGVFVESEDRTRVMEYSDLPPECAMATDVSGRLHFGLANVAIHLFEANFLEHFCQAGRSNSLPLHISLRKVPYINAAAHLVRPVEINAIKLERFIFDLLPQAECAVLLEGRREEIFSPVKNSAGLDSVETSKRDQTRQFADWLARGKVDLIRDAGGTPPFFLEIAPSFAVSCEEFLEKWMQLEKKPAVGANFYLE
ncbi:MAG: UTP--glucose-1-phosphate uridylyltransferase [Puniceicoccales bacterium]|jgi:UDP-N-acetylglucosamine/UDP-N-acetylgalactosamine diphosphorylase|nr:UTP--glucose-1-phosphate uridylyltransferase [Puniceicoccales bacterium]